MQIENYLIWWKERYPYLSPDYNNHPLCGEADCQWGQFVNGNSLHIQTWLDWLNNHYDEKHPDVPLNKRAWVNGSNYESTRKLIVSRYRMDINNYTKYSDVYNNKERKITHLMEI
jgi:hypothetical protein